MGFKLGYWRVKGQEGEGGGGKKRKEKKKKKEKKKRRKKKKKKRRKKEEPTTRVGHPKETSSPSGNIVIKRLNEANGTSPKRSESGCVQV